MNCPGAFLGLSYSRGEGRNSQLGTFSFFKSQTKNSKASFKPNALSNVTLEYSSNTVNNFTNEICRGAKQAADELDVNLITFFGGYLRSQCQDDVSIFLISIFVSFKIALLITGAIRFIVLIF